MPEENTVINKMNQGMTLIQGLIVAAAPLMALIAAWFALSLRTSQLEWKVDQILPTTKEMTTLNNDISHLNTIIEQSIADRANLHKQVDGQRDMNESMRERIDRLEYQKGVKP